MASNQTAEVVKYFRERGQNGFSNAITYLGAEQRFVGALRNSNLNNLEEQYLIGTDSYSISYQDEDGNDIVETSYHINDAAHSKTNYYKLISTEYANSIIYTEYKYLDEQTLGLDSSESCTFVYGDGSEDYPDTDSLYVEEGEASFTFEEDSFLISPSNFSTIAKDELHYITDNGVTDLLVLTKTKDKKLSHDGNQVYYKQSITNHLK